MKSGILGLGVNCVLTKDYAYRERHLAYLDDIIKQQLDESRSGRDVLEVEGLGLLHHGMISHDPVGHDEACEDGAGVL